MSLEEALVHVPTQPTYAIRIKWTRIYRGGKDPDETFGELQPSPLYTIRTYSFDDVCFSGSQDEEGSGEDRSGITREIADEIVRDFAIAGCSKEVLLVHCVAGVSRSPAVAMALNDIFHLGVRSRMLAEKYPSYNKFVYRMFFP